MQPFDLPWFGKYAMCVGLTFALSFVSYDALVRYSWLGAILNGRKTRPARAQRGAPQVVAAE